MVAKYPPVPNPTTDVVALCNAGIALKETVEMLTLQRGDPLLAAVTWQDLVDLRLILPSQVPTKIANR